MSLGLLKASFGAYIFNTECHECLLWHILTWDYGMRGRMESTSSLNSRFHLPLGPSYRLEVIIWCSLFSGLAALSFLYQIWPRCSLIGNLWRSSWSMYEPGVICQCMDIMSCLILWYFCVSLATVRKVTFPMGSYGASTVKYTTTLDWKYLAFDHLQFAFCRFLRIEIVLCFFPTWGYLIRVICVDPTQKVIDQCQPWLQKRTTYTQSANSSHIIPGYGVPCQILASCESQWISSN